MNNALHSRARGRRIGAIVAGALISLALAACSASGTAGRVTTNELIPQAAEWSSVPVPGPAIDVRPLAGKTVYWIPITSQAAIFGIEQRAAEEAFSSAGIHLQLCDGKADPATVAACVSQAIGARAGGIIATSIPPEFAEQAFSSAVDARVPVEFVNTYHAAIPKTWGNLAAAMPANFIEQAKVNDDLIIKDSGGKANVLLVGVSDSSVTTSASNIGMRQYLADKCPGCTISSVETGATTQADLAAQVKAELTKNPSIQYISVEFDSYGPPVVQALRELNKSDSIKLVTMLGNLDGMQRVADGTAFADTGYSIAAVGWNQADIMMRLMLGKDPAAAAHRAPFKTYTAANIKGLDLSEAGWISGKWSSGDDFRSMYKKLWGVH